MKQSKKTSKTALTRLQRLYIYILPITILALTVAIMGLINAKTPTPALIIMCVLLLITAVITVVLLAVEGKEIQVCVDSLFSDNMTASKLIFNSMTIPCVVCTEQGQVIERNQPFTAISTDMYLHKLFTPEELAFTQHSFEKQIGDKYYIAHVNPIERDNGYSRKTMFIYMIDISLQVHFSKKFESTKPVVAKIYVDNYDNMSIENDMYSNTVLNKIEEHILHLTKSVTMGIYRREQRSFLMVFEAAKLPAFEEQISKFLHSIHSIKTDAGKAVTLSIGVGCEENIDDAAGLASEAIEMALGRGGDQAVVKRSAKASPKYYGDGNNSPELTNSRVYVRTISNNLRELILDAGEIYIMGHRDEDIDCIGSALGLLGFIITKLDKKAYFVCGGGITGLVNNINTQLPDYLRGFVVPPEEILPIPKQDALLIIVDTQREIMLSSPELYRQIINNVVVIDHHRRSEDAITTTSLSFMESAASSTAEMVTEILQNLSDQKKPITKFEATSLFAGIAMDTKGFIFNTGRRTFEAAAILKKCGADTTAAMMMYQDDKSRYEVIASLVSKATLYPNKIAISVSKEPIDDPRPVIARAADTLVRLKGISAAIVLLQVGDNVIVSARSIGEVNVQLICEALGGGGHRTVAGAQLRGVDCDEALSMTLEAVNSYYGEKEKTENESNSIS